MRRRYPRPMRIAGRDITPGAPPLVIAEIGVNHDGDPARALELVEAAASAGADAVKFQYFRAVDLLSRSSKLAAYQRVAGESDPASMLSRLELDPGALGDCAQRAHDLGLLAVVTVFSEQLVDDVAGLGWDAFKTASPDIVNKPLLDRLAREGMPMIVSTGASEIDEVERAVGWLSGARERLALLQCVSCYPLALRDAALGAMLDLQSRTGLLIGYSDHTTERITGALAVALGACILEKHLTYSVDAPGPDHRASLDPDGLREYVELARRAHSAPWSVPDMARATGVEDIDAPMGEPVKRVLDIERDVREVSRQSLTSTRAISPGERIAEGDLTIKRPGFGAPPYLLHDAINRRAARAIEPDACMGLDDFDPTLDPKHRPPAQEERR